MGPHEEGDDVTLTCRTVGGHPEPRVRWLVNGVLVDDEYEHNAGDVIENRLTWPAVARRDLDSVFTCQAVNTMLTEPKDAIVTLDLHCEYYTMKYTAYVCAFILLICLSSMKLICYFKKSDKMRYSSAVLSTRM